MLFEFGNFCVDVDVARTKAFYNKSEKTVLVDCGCINCRNYYNAISKVPDKVKEFFNALGIDPLKTPEATWWDTDEKGIAYYSIYFHIAGTLVKSAEIYRSIGDGSFALIPENLYEIDKGFEAAFTSETAFLEKDFPTPCIQLEIHAHLPLVDE